MGMGMVFTWLAYERDTEALDLMVQAAFKVMSNDVLISIPLFVFMGYLVERANLIDKLFRSLHLALARVPGSLAVATLFTCAVFATATGIVGAVVTLMGLLACRRCSGRLRREDLRRRDHRGRLPGHPDPAFGDADRLRRHGRRVGGAALCGASSRADAGRPVHRLRHHPGQAEALADAAAVGRAAHVPLPARWRRSAQRREARPALGC